MVVNGTNAGARRIPKADATGSRDGEGEGDEWRRDRAGMRSVWHGRHCAPFGMGSIARAMEAAMNDRTAL
jgi:hypothetical protein